MTTKTKILFISLLIFVFLSSCGASNDSRKNLILSSKVSNIPFSIFLKGKGSDEILKKIDEVAQKRGYGFYYYLSISSLNQLNKIITKYDFSTFPNNDEIKKISKSFFSKNRLFIIYLPGNSSSKIEAYKVNIQDNILNINVRVNNSKDLDVKTDCLIVGVKKDFIGKTKDIKLIYDQLK